MVGRQVARGQVAKAQRVWRRLAYRVHARFHLVRLHMEAQNERTLAKDMGHWNLYWEPICALFNTSSIRDAPGAATGTDVDAQEADIQLLCFALIMIMLLMPAKKKVSPGAKPQSGFNVLLAIRRIHTVLGVMLVSLKYVRMTLRGLLQRFVRVHGHDTAFQSRVWRRLVDSVQVRFHVKWLVPKSKDS